MDTFRFLKKNLNAPRPSEHPPVREKHHLKEKNLESYLMNSHMRIDNTGEAEHQSIGVYFGIVCLIHGTGLVLHSIYL